MTQSEETKKALAAVNALYGSAETDDEQEVFGQVRDLVEAALSQSPQGAMTDKELRDWIFQWSQNEGKTPLESDINDLIWTVQKAAPQPETGADDISLLLKVAANLVLGARVPSYTREDHEKHVPAWMLRELEKAHDDLRSKALMIKRAVDNIRAALQSKREVE